MCCVYILYIVLLTHTILAALGVSLFKMPLPPSPIHQLVNTHTHTHESRNTQLSASRSGKTVHKAARVNTLYIVSDFLWQICVVVLVILFKLTVDFSDKWLKLVCTWKTNARPFITVFTKGSWLLKKKKRNSSFFCPFVCSLYVFAFVISVVKPFGGRERRVEMYPGLSVFI